MVGDQSLWGGVVINGGGSKFVSGGWSFIDGCCHLLMVICGCPCMGGHHPCVSVVIHRVSLFSMCEYCHLWGVIVIHGWGMAIH